MLQIMKLNNANPGRDSEGHWAASKLVRRLNTDSQYQTSPHLKSQELRKSLVHAAQFANLAAMTPLMTELTLGGHMDDEKRVIVFGAQLIKMFHAARTGDLVTANEMKRTILGVVSDIFRDGDISAMIDDVRGKQRFIDLAEKIEKATRNDWSDGNYLEAVITSARNGDPWAMIWAEPLTGNTLRDTRSGTRRMGNGIRDEAARSRLQMQSSSSTNPTIYNEVSTSFPAIIDQTPATEVTDNSSFVIARAQEEVERESAWFI